MMIGVLTGEEGEGEAIVKSAPDGTAKYVLNDHDGHDRHGRIG